MERPRNITNADRLRAILEKNLRIAEEMADQALALAVSGEDIRSNKKRSGLAGYQHCMQKAIDEVIRLRELITDGGEAKPQTYIIQFAKHEDKEE